jgi:hypothetical protein
MYTALTVFFAQPGTYVTRYCGHFWPIVQPQMIDEGVSIVVFVLYDRL